jgi:hypothetical protein
MYSRNPLGRANLQRNRDLNACHCTLASVGAFGFDRHMNNMVVGVAAILIGLLGFWQRDRITQLNRRWNKRLGKPGELASEVGSAKYFGTGAILMVPAGAATVIYTLITGQSGRATDESQALVIIIIAAVWVCCREHSHCHDALQATVEVVQNLPGLTIPFLNSSCPNFVNLELSSQQPPTLRSHIPRNSPHLSNETLHPSPLK